MTGLSRPRLRGRPDPFAPTIRECLDHLIGTRIQNNQNVMGAICGETGSGKSYAALSIGERCDPNFSIENVCFSIPEFIEALRRSGPGDILVFDESQAWSARRAMSKQNVEMTDIAAMCRFTLVSVLFTAPALSFIDVSLRRLMHLYVHVSPINRARCPPWQRNRTHARVYQVRHPRFPSQDAGAGLRFANPRIPVVRGRRQRTVELSTVWFERPAQGLLDAYEARKRRVFEGRLNEAQRRVGGNSPLPQLPEPNAATGPMDPSAHLNSLSEGGT